MVPLHKLKDDSGFSLVEISIALLIMGIIIGGILKGQDLLESARLKSLTTQVNEYRVAVTLFQDRYGALPGDYAHASSYIEGTLKDGNGDGRIEGSGLASSGAGHEAFSFWAHLSAAELITASGGRGREKGAHSGYGAPKAKIGGIFTVQYNVFGEGHHWFVLGEAVGNSGQGAGLTPLQAMSLDQKGIAATRGKEKSEQKTAVMSPQDLVSRLRASITVKIKIKHAFFTSSFKRGRRLFSS